MKWLVLIHVMSAIIGIGPTYFGHILFRKGQQAGELKRSLELFQLLNFFPKIGGSIAVLTGLILVWLENWSFATLWILGSLVLYAAIQVIAVGMLGPVAGKLYQLLADSQPNGTPDAEGQRTKLLARASRLYYAASTLGVVLFIFMILKP